VTLKAQFPFIGLSVLRTFLNVLKIAEYIKMSNFFFLILLQPTGSNHTEWEAVLRANIVALMQDNESYIGLPTDYLTNSMEQTDS
jgi:hypothetical protein